MKLAVRIDSSKVVCSASEGIGRPQIIQDSVFKDDTESPVAISFSGNTMLIGKLAEVNRGVAQAIHPVVFSSDFLTSDVPVAESSAGAQWSGAALTAMIIKKSIRDASAQYLSNVTSVNLIVPSYLSIRQLRMLDKARTLLGSISCDFVEGAVAAVSYFLSKEPVSEKILLVLETNDDVLSITAIAAGRDKLQILSREHVMGFGDRFILDAISDILKGQITAIAKLSSQEMTLLGDELNMRSKQILESFMRSNETQHCWLLAGDSIVRASISVSALQEALKPKMDTLVRRIHSCLSDVELQAMDIDKVLLCGKIWEWKHACRFIEQSITDFTGRLDFDEAALRVVLGGGRYKLRGDLVELRENWQPRLVTVSLFSISVRQQNGVEDVLILKNAPLPCQSTITIHRPALSRDGRIVMELVQMLPNDMKDSFLFIESEEQFDFSAGNFELILKMQDNMNLGIKLKDLTNRRDVKIMVKSAGKTPFGVQHEEEQLVSNTPLNSAV